MLETFAPKPVTIRTLDVGGDKDLPFFPIAETNPFLGRRGIRFTLDHPEIFLTQLRALRSFTRRQARELSNKTLKIENEADTHHLLNHALNSVGLSALVSVN